MIIPEKSLEEVKKLHDQGLHLQAYNLAVSISPLANWEGTDAILLASHIVFQLGAMKTSDDWAKKAWRRDKLHSKAMFYRAADISQAKGPLPALIFINKYGSDFRADEKLSSWWYSLQAEIFGQLRDFVTADLWHEKAAQICPQESWVWVAKSHILELQDRYDEAVEVARKAFELAPFQRVTVAQLSHLLTLLEKYEEALEILTNASTQSENVWIIRQLADLQTELEMHNEAFNSLEKILALTPIREADLDKWHYGSLSDAAYQIDDLAKAIHYAEISKSPFHQKIKERLENRNGSEKRVRLKLGFIRQHQLTCAPATLSNIARFWQKKAEHLELAAEMCYEGTPAYKERIWASENGWATKEFTVNWENTVELINRGVPFTLATIHPGNGHLQAIVGYDENRKTMLVRDPFYQRFDEFLGEELLESQKSSGPRGMALVPIEKAELLNNLNLAESKIYDYQFTVDAALEKHDREKAKQALEALEKEYPAHRLTWSSRWALAAYDSNTPQLLQTVENLQKLFPEDINLKMSYLMISSEFISREERLNKLEEYSKDEKTDPLLWQMYGQELGLDANTHEKALRWLIKSLRIIPNNGQTIRFIADILWSQRRFEDALKLYRFAACLNDKDEQFSFSYFIAARHLKKEAEAINFLADRFERFGHLSSLPGRSLFYALRELGQTVEAFQVLEKALQKRPADGELKLFIAESKAKFGELEIAEKLLFEAQDKSPKNYWLRNAAKISELQGNLQKSLEYWREVVKVEPTALDTHETIAFLLSATEGKLSAQNYLRKVSREYPFNRNLQKLRLSYLQDKTTEAIAVLRDLVRLNPQDVWSQRELVRWLCQVKKYEKAFEAAKKAIEIDPNDSLNHYVLGLVLSQSGKRNEALKSFEKSLKLSIDTDVALTEWLKLCRNAQEKLEVIKFVRNELRQQVSFGAGIMAYRDQARRLIEAKELLHELKKIQLQNKDSWFATSVVVQQLVDMHNLDEALELALQNTQKFPLIYQVWHDLSLIHKLRGENESEIESLKKAVTINSTWSYGFQQLCEAFQRAGKLEEAETILREAITRMPLDPFLYGFLSEVLWKQNKKDEALITARKAIAIQPDYEWAWHTIKTWGEQLKEPGLAIELARELTVQKPKDVAVWLRYAQMLDNGKFSQAQLDAVEEALKIEPQNSLGLAVKANSLADARRFDEALKVCQTTFDDGHRPEQLRYVEAGIEMSRGNYEKSITLLEELTNSSPDYYPAWERLANIYREWDEKKQDYLRITREMTRLAPQEATAFGFLGEASLINDFRDEAKEAYKQAFTLDRDYSFAGLSLFDLYYEDNDVENSQKVLQLLDKFVNNENSLIRQIAFYAKQKDLDKTSEYWKKLFFNEKAGKPQFDYALKELNAANLGREGFVWNTPFEIYLADDVNPLLGAYLIEHEWNSKGEKTSLELLNQLKKNDKVWVEAVIKFMEILVSERPSSLRNFINNNQTNLESNNDLWASTIFALNSIQEYQRAKEWFADWKKREPIKPWMFWNYSLALRRLGERDEAIEINRKALEVEYDQTVNLHLLMIGLDKIHSEDYESAKQTFEQITTQGMSEWDSFFYYLLNKHLEIYQLISNSQFKEAEDITFNTFSACLGIQTLWKDNIMRDHFEKSSKLIINLHPSSWTRFRLRFKILLSKPIF